MYDDLPTLERRLPTRRSKIRRATDREHDAQVESVTARVVNAITAKPCPFCAKRREIAIARGERIRAAKGKA